jgi:predicted DNA-binding protein (UPF0251 family)
MPRPRLQRCISNKPIPRFYKPNGIRTKDLKQINLSYDQLEAIRLADAENMTHEQAAVLMNISRPTFSRLVAEARNIVAQALNNSWALKIEGGNFIVNEK